MEDDKTPEEKEKERVAQNRRYHTAVILPAKRERERRLQIALGVKRKERAEAKARKKAKKSRKVNR